MKEIYLLLTIITLCSCNNTQETQFNWLLGNWERTNDSNENKTYEYWSKKSDTEYIGLGCTLKNKDTIFKENIHLIKEKEQWIFKVIGVNEEPTLFPLSDISNSGFICENPKNDFPKKIRYSLDGKKLKATISDGKKEIPFLFKKKL